MVDEFEEKFLKPIVSASYPATLAGLSLTALVVSKGYAEQTPLALQFFLIMATLVLLISAICSFFYRIYRGKRALWTIAAIMYLTGLFCIILAVIILFVALVTLIF